MRNSGRRFIFLIYTHFGLPQVDSKQGKLKSSKRAISLKDEVSIRESRYSLKTSCELYDFSCITIHFHWQHLFFQAAEFDISDSQEQGSEDRPLSKRRKASIAKSAILVWYRTKALTSWIFHYIPIDYSILLYLFLVNKWHWLLLLNVTGIYINARALHLMKNPQFGVNNEL